MMKLQNVGGILVITALAIMQGCAPPQPSPDLLAPTEAQLKTAHPALTCETIVGTRSCHLGNFLPGQKVTDFLLRNGKVVRVTVGFVID